MERGGTTTTTTSTKGAFTLLLVIINFLHTTSKRVGDKSVHKSSKIRMIHTSFIPTITNVWAGSKENLLKMWENDLLGESQIYIYCKEMILDKNLFTL